MKSLGTAFLTRAEIEARNGNIKAAADDIRADRKLGSLVGQDPSLIATLVQIAMESREMTAVQRIAARYTDDPSALKALREAIEMPVRPPNFAFAMRGEAFMAVQIGRNAAFQDTRSYADGEQAPKIDYASLLTDGLPTATTTRATMARILQAWTEYGQFAKDHGGDPVALSNKLQSIANSIASKDSRSYDVVKLIFPQFEEAATAVLEAEANREVTDAWFGGMIKHAETGRYPSRIDEIPGRWIDPFTGQPLHVKTTHGPGGDGFRVYSDGPGKTDHGGIARWEKKGSDGSAISSDKVDIVASFPPRPRSTN
jgi:hypothetical protein